MIIVKHNQTLLDIAYYQSNSYLAVIDYAFVNKIAVDEVLIPNQLLSEAPVVNYESEVTLINHKIAIPEDYKVLVRQNQNLCDIAIQETGSIFSLLEVAYNNRLSLDYEVHPKTLISNKTNAEFYDEDIASFFKEKSIIIATKDKQELVNYSLPLGFPISF
jgi:delta 1-pyrroline-5-carboxylate dehydrogenase